MSKKMKVVSVILCVLDWIVHKTMGGELRRIAERNKTAEQQRIIGGGYK